MTRPSSPPSAGRSSKYYGAVLVPSPPQSQRTTLVENSVVRQANSRSIRAQGRSSRDRGIRRRKRPDRAAQRSRTVWTRTTGKHLRVHTPPVASAASLDGSTLRFGPRAVNENMPPLTLPGISNAGSEVKRSGEGQGGRRDQRSRPILGPSRRSLRVPHLTPIMATRIAGR